MVIRIPMKKKLINLCLVFVSTCFALLLAEGIVRVFIPQNLIYNNQAVWRPDAKFGWRHHENIDTRINFGSGEVSFRTDGQGYRMNTEPKVLPDDSSQNVLVIGDSFLEAVQVESQSTGPKVLQRSLNKLPGIDTYFYNSGVSGWNPNHYLFEAQRVLEEDKPKINSVLVFLYIANDIVGLEIDTFYEVKKVPRKVLRMPRSFNKRELAQALLYPMDYYLERNSHLFMLIKNRNKNFLKRLGLAAYPFPRVFQKSNRAMKDWEVTSQICKKIQKAFGQREIPVTFVLIPATYQVNEQVREEYMKSFEIDPADVDFDQPGRILAEYFKRDSMQLYDPTEFFRQKTKNGSVLYGTFDAHFNAEGHAAMAEYLLPVLANQLKKDQPLP